MFGRIYQWNHLVLDLSFWGCFLLWVQTSSIIPLLRFSIILWLSFRLKFSRHLSVFPKLSDLLVCNIFHSSLLQTFLYLYVISCFTLDYIRNNFPISALYFFKGIRKMWKRSRLWPSTLLPTLGLWWVLSSLYNQHRHKKRLMNEVNKDWLEATLCLLCWFSGS